MNKIILIGNLTKDPELTQTSNDISVCRFSLAVGRKFANQDGERETDFFNIIAWRQLGEICHKYLKKGNKAAVNGSLQVRKYQAKDGTEKTMVEVVAEDVEFLTPKNAQNNGENEGYKERKPQSNKSTGRANKVTDLYDYVPEDDDDLPF